MAYGFNVFKFSFLSSVCWMKYFSVNISTRQHFKRSVYRKQLTSVWPTGYTSATCCMLPVCDKQFTPQTIQHGENFVSPTANRRRTGYNCSICRTGQASSLPSRKRVVTKLTGTVPLLCMLLYADISVSEHTASNYWFINEYLIGKYLK
jgi:hypothetical protein